MDIIETTNLTKKFGATTSVEGLNLAVPSGGIYGFLGPNGAGKSTTIRMLLGLMRPSAGEVRIFGLPLAERRIDILKKTGALVESPSYYGHLSASENLDLTRRLLKLPAGEVGRVLAIVGLDDAGRKPVDKFSLGMKQRLAIAHALLGNPRLLILDEPTNGLDPAGIHQVRDLIRRLPGETGATVLVSSHLLSEVELVASHVGIIHKGRLIFQGTLAELRRQQGAGQQGAGQQGAGWQWASIRIDARPQQKAADFLKASGYPAELDGAYVRVQDASLDEAALNKALVLQGYSVYHLSRQQGSLEDIFLSVTASDAQAGMLAGAARVAEAAGAAAGGRV